MVKEELRALCEAYEMALVANDVASLENFFWDSPETIRLGPTENLFGAESIKSFRRNRPALDLQRKVTRVEYIVLNNDHGVINLCFEKIFRGHIRSGRQTQIWKRFPELGWKIVSAHVSFIEPA
jgi:hypothetical protein